MSAPIIGTEYRVIIDKDDRNPDEVKCASAIREVWLKNGKIHRDDGPAVTLFEESGEPLQYEYYKEGLRHRDNGLPAICYPKQAGGRWYVKGLRHRENGPAFQDIGKDGVTRDEEWYLLDKLHRIGGPASIFVDRRTGVVTDEIWSQNDVLHRIDGPAQIDRDSNTGIITYEGWYKDGIAHRVDGPACTIRDQDSGRILTQQFIQHGNLIWIDNSPTLENM